MNKESVSVLGIFVAIILLLLLIVMWIARTEAQNEAAMWNNGYCSCGGKWIFCNGSSDRFDHYYWFKCDKCNNATKFKSVNPAVKQT